MERSLKLALCVGCVLGLVASALQSVADRLDGIETYLTADAIEARLEEALAIFGEDDTTT